MPVINQDSRKYTVSHYGRLCLNIGVSLWKNLEAFWSCMLRILYGLSVISFSTFGFYISTSLTDTRSLPLESVYEFSRYYLTGHTILEYLIILNNTLSGLGGNQRQHCMFLTALYVRILYLPFGSCLARMVIFIKQGALSLLLLPSDC